MRRYYIIHALDKEIGYVIQIRNKWPTWFVPGGWASNGQPKSHNSSITPQSTPPATYGPYIPNPQSSKNSWTKLPRSNSAYPNNPTLIKTFTRIESMMSSTESMMFISKNVKNYEGSWNEYWKLLCSKKHQQCHFSKGKNILVWNLFFYYYFILRKLACPSFLDVLSIWIKMIWCASWLDSLFWR